MEPTAFDLEKIHALYQAGHIDTAKQQYEAYLKINPNSADAWHALGMIFIEQKDLISGSQFIKKAVDLEPNNPIFQLHLANALKMRGLYQDATDLLRETIKHHQDYSPAYNNLGILHFLQNKIAEAIAYYKIAILKDPHYIDAYYNLGLALTKANQLEEATETYQYLIEHAPRHSAGKFQLARIYMQQNSWEKALNLLVALEQDYPEHLETQVNIATCYLKKGELEKSKIHYLKAIELDPTELQALYNVAHILMQENKLTEAIYYYEEVVKIDNSNFSAHNNLGAIYIFRQQNELALKHFQAAHRLQPENTYITHIIKILTQDSQLLTSPPAYISSLFDYYADHYEQHLLNALHYQAPQVLLNAFLTTSAPDDKLNILDIGCGTGLCGQLFKPY
ncbi:MAG TPA: tetratricopeptide repeat protein, partial [Gammaproteobacteria bacterium]|nr:tetratricopeptide repeat protein [Gammaproteobacteria bacterium]